MHFVFQVLYLETKPQELYARGQHMHGGPDLSDFRKEKMAILGAHWD